MKRELAFALEAQSQLTEPLGRTRSSTPHYRGSEKIPNFTENESESNGSIDRPSKNSGEISMCNVLYVYRRNKRFKTSRPEFESVTAEEPIDDFASPICVEEKNSKFVAAEIEEKSTAAVVKNGFPVEIPRRFTRSALKSNVEGSELPAVNSVVSEGVKDDEAVLEGEGNEIGAFGTPKKKMELKMSKKIALKKKPTTVKELFETGLLEGYPVFYKGWKKGNELRGEIKDFGILCSCSLCNGSRVVLPSEFEVHACKTHRSALRYICLENGKSLLQVVKACKKSSLETLEETIQNVIGPLPVKESIICQNCKVSFLPTCAAKQSCDSCLDSMKSQARPTDTNIDSLKSQTSPTNTAVVKDGPSKPVMVMKSSTRGKVSMSSQKRSQGKMKRKSSEPALATTSPRSAPVSPRSAPVRNLSREKSQWKITKKSSRSALVPKSPNSGSVRMPQNKSQGKISKKLSKSVPLPRPRKSYSKSKWKITKKDQRMHKLVFEEGGLPDGTEVAYYSRGMKLLEGYKKGSGIFCRCCNSEVSASQFEAHAGWASRRKPYGYIYTSNGVSLHELAISLLKGRKYSTKDNDDLCIICADGGNLLLCDGCPRAFHKECAMLSSVPRGKWYCTYCNNMFQREKFVERNANALAAGRVSGVDLIEQITTRCIRIVKTPEDAEVIACVLCRGYDFSKSGFGSRTVILCDQCEKEYHIGCLKKHKMADLKELPKEKWFCCMDCRRIYSALQNLLICGAEKLPDSLLDTIRKKEKDKGLDSVTNIDVSWRVLSGKLASRETRLLLSEAVAIFHDCFDPIVDSVTGCDFIPTMVYGRNIRGQDFGGMYCAILTVNSSVVSAGILRVFGRDMAELPLVATSNGKQGKGYFQLLFSCIEKLLAFLKVKTLVLPAAEVAESIWTDKFCFKRIAPEQFINYKKDFWQMLTFKGTSMLEKEVPQCRLTRRDTTAFDISEES